MNQIGIRQAMASLSEPADEPPDLKPHPSDAAVRRLIDNLADRGSFSGDVGDGAQARLTKSQFAALGPLISLHHIRSDEKGDVHRANFAGGRLLCSTRRDETGKITYAELVPG